MKTIHETIEELKDLFNSLDSWEERYAYIIDLGKELPELDPMYQIDECYVSGCQSDVWIKTELNNGVMYITASSDSLIVKGLLALVIKVLSGHTPQEILDLNIEEVFKDLGLLEHLSPIRANGVVSVVNYIQQQAKNYKI